MDSYKPFLKLIIKSEKILNTVRIIPVQIKLTTHARKLDHSTDSSISTDFLNYLAQGTVSKFSQKHLCEIDCCSVGYIYDTVTESLATKYQVS